MPKTRLNPDHFRELAAEYRGLAKASSTQQDKAELLNLAERLAALAQSDVWKAQIRKAPPAHRAHRRIFRFASEPTS
jgi:hypothetical protein